MTPFASLDLEAVDPARNIRRRWRITATPDLFGQMVVETAWGRIGTRGRVLVRSFADQGEAERYVARLLTRRRGARRRIGTDYADVTGRGS